MILVVAGIKGGVGKTTVAVHMAVLQAAAGRDVLLIDADNQATATDFTNLRREVLGQASYTAVQLLGSAVRGEGLRLAARFDDVVIDVGGRDSAGQRAALSIADKAVLPMLPSSFDLWSLDQATEMIQEARDWNKNLQVSVFVNRADAQGRDNDDSRALAGELSGLDVLNLQVGNRKAIRNAVGQGLAVIELRPRDVKAVEEIRALHRYLFGMLLIS